MTSRTTPPDSNSAARPHPTRLAEALRQNLAPLSIRRKGALGQLRTALAEKIEILIILTQDPDKEIRHQAFVTLENWDIEELSSVLADPSCPVAALEFAAQSLVTRHPRLLEALLHNTALPPELQNQLLAQIEALASQWAETSGDRPEVAPSPQDLDHGETTLEKISRMTAVEKVKCALMGSREERLILIRDPNKLVARAVLQSPKLSEAEIEAYAAMRNVSEEVLRMMATNRAFTKSYAILHALVNNPRAPLDATLSMIGRLNDRDLRGIAANRNVPDALRTAAAKLLSARHTTKNISFSRKH
ncbi:MAG TPA: hypothetical protein VFZ08_02015 [Terriglobia bacterium]|nr:hypothetical protein [Terriglobia bacterium]